MRRALSPARTGWLLLFACLVAGLAILASDIRQAPFRLNIKTSSLWFTVDGDNATLAFDASAWRLHHASNVETSTAQRFGADAMSIAASPPAAPALLRFYPNAGGHITLTYSAGAGLPLTVQSLTEPAFVHVTSPSAADGRFSFVISTKQGKHVHPSTTFIEALASAIAVQPAAATSSWVTPLAVRQLGFGKKDERNTFQTGVIGGELYFMDNAAQEIKIFRGTDLRIAGTHLVLDALVATPEGIELTVSGKARSAGLHLGSIPDASAHSLMPSYFDRAQRSPLAILSVGALGLLISAAGLWFAAAQHTSARAAP